VRYVKLVFDRRQTRWMHLSLFIRCWHGQQWEKDRQVQTQVGAMCLLTVMASNKIPR